MKKPYVNPLVPTVAVDRILSRVHVGTSDEEVRKLIDDRIVIAARHEPRWAMHPGGLANQTVRYALWRHHQNLAEYRSVMGGRHRRAPTTFATYAEAREDVREARAAGMTQTPLAIVLDHRTGRFQVVTLTRARIWERVPAETRRYWIEQTFPPGTGHSRRRRSPTTHAAAVRRARRK